MKKFWLFFLNLCLSFNSLSSQGLTGVFKGQLKQDPNKVFLFEIRIDKADTNGYIDGTCYIESYGDGVSQRGDFGTIEFNGQWIGNTVTIQETKVVKEERKSSNYYWCIAKLNLTAREENNQLILEGPWLAPGGCLPGTLKVTQPFGLFKSADFCMNTKFNDWKKEVNYNSKSESEKRNLDDGLNMKMDLFRQTCICSKLEWGHSRSEYNADSGYYKITVNGFLPFRIYVPQNDVNSFNNNFYKLSLDHIKCDLDNDSQALKINYIAVINPENAKKYTSEPIPIIPEVKLETLENRVVETKYMISVESGNIELEVWDNNLVDGDIISLNLNGYWILKNYTVRKGKKKIKLILTDKENILIMHAENLGSKPPNTASIVINDGIKAQTIILNSDEGKSEAIKITRK